MTSKERISKILDFKTPDRIGLHDTFFSKTIEGWKDHGLPFGLVPEDYFDFDLELLDIDEILKGDSPCFTKHEKFRTITFSEPFQKLCEDLGMENTLRNMASSPEKIKSAFAAETERILGALSSIMERGIVFDGAWAWGDLAYKERCFFSLNDYKRFLFPFHKKIFRALDSKGLPVLFHSDGMVSELIPYLLEAGVRALHPLDEASGIDIGKLFKRYSKKMVFMGCMDIRSFFKGNSLLDALKKKIDMFKENSFYIYDAGFPITPDIAFEDYRQAIETVKRYGAY